MASNRQITLRMVGQEEDHGDVRFHDFIKQLDIIKNALYETERIILKKQHKKKSVYYKVIALSHNSPASIVIEAVPIRVQDDKSEEIVDAFFTNIDNIDQGVIPPGFDYDAVCAYKEIPSLYEKKRLTELIISNNGDPGRPVDKLAQKLDAIMGPDEVEQGSVTGMLEQINLHFNQNIFTIYPTSRRARLRCRFPQDLRKDAIRAVGQYVNVTGKLKYKPNLDTKYPYEIVISRIEIYSPEEELPTLASLAGIAPDATGDMTSEDFIRELRNDW